VETLIEPHCIVGVGYEGQDLSEFINLLKRMDTRILADVRLNPVSRKRGFSKRLLAASLADAGISYSHFPELGNPRWNREGFGGPPAEVRTARARFRDMIGGEVQCGRLDEIVTAARDGVVAVMCFEADERACHRYVVIQELRRRSVLYEAVA
jgi:uncharacterized protein (DUF488 family)